MITLRDLLVFLFRHKTRILTIFLTATIAVTALVYYFPEKYEVSAKLLVKVGRENAAISPAVTNPTIWSVGKQMKEILRSEVEIIDSAFLAEKLVADLGPEFFDPPQGPPESILQYVKRGVAAVLGFVRDMGMEVLYFLDIIREVTPEEGTILGFRKNLYVAAEKDSNVVTVQLKTPDPDIGRPAVDRLIELYLVHRTTVYSNAGLYDFFQAETAKHQHLREQAALALGRLRSETRIADLPSQKGALLGQLMDRRRERDEAQLRIDELRVVIAEAHARAQGTNAMEVVKEETLRNPMLVLYEDKLVDLETERGAVAQRYSEDVPIAQTLSAEIGRIQDLMENAPGQVQGKVENSSNPTYKRIEAEIVDSQIELARQEARLAAEERAMAALESDIFEMNRHEAELKRLSIELEVTEENYLLLKRKMEEARIDGALDDSRVANVSVVGPATSSIVPVKKMKFIPRKVYFILLAMILSLAVGVLYALCLDYFYHVLRNERDARSLGVPVLGGFFDADPGAEDRAGDDRA